MAFGPPVLGSRPSFDPSGAARHDGIFGLPGTPEEARVVLVPVPWEATVSYGSGTVEGPAAILTASRQVDLLDRETGHPYRDGIAMLPIPEDVRAWSDQARRTALPVIEAGGPGDGPALRQDLRQVARLVQVGVRDVGEDEDALIRDQPERARTYFDADLRAKLFDGETWHRLALRIAADLPRDVFVSFDIDGLDPALCPHTGTPVLGGLSFPEAMAVLRALVETGRRIVGFDLVEVAPDPAGRSEWDGNVGARVLYKESGTR